MLIEKDFKPSVMYSYVRSRQLEGRFDANPKTGCWITTANRIGFGWGWPNEVAWPYDGSAANWPPKSEPPDIDQLAKELRLSVYQRIRTLVEAKMALYNKMPICIALPIHSQWKAATNGEIRLPETGEQLRDTHCVVLVGYDDSRSRFIVRNSWGTTWGDNGYGYLPYEYFTNYCYEAWYSDIGGTLESQPDLIVDKHLDWVTYAGVARPIINSEVNIFLICDPLNNERIGWCFTIERDNQLEVEEFFVRPQYRNKGYGSLLAKRLKEAVLRVDLPICMWVPWADQEPPAANHLVLEKILVKLGLQKNNSGVLWAAWKATPTQQPLSSALQVLSTPEAPRNVHKLLFVMDCKSVIPY